MFVIGAVSFVCIIFREEFDEGFYFSEILFIARPPQVMIRDCSVFRTVFATEDVSKISTLLETIEA